MEQEKAQALLVGAAFTLTERGTKVKHNQGQSARDQGKPRPGTCRLSQGPGEIKAQHAQDQRRTQGEQRPGTQVQPGVRARLKSTCLHTSAPTAHPLCFPFSP